jgi:hypothetical protein
MASRRFLTSEAWRSRLDGSEERARLPVVDDEAVVKDVTVSVEACVDHMDMGEVSFAELNATWSERVTSRSLELGSLSSAEVYVDQTKGGL